MSYVSLPMYDWPETQPQTDRLWKQLATLLQDNGIDCPVTLDRKTASATQWTSGDCLLSQTCGWPYIDHLYSHLTAITTPVYGIEGCNGTTHCSRLVCRADDPRLSLAEFSGATVVINEADSQSGHQAMKSALTAASLPAQFFAKGFVSGAHRQSIQLVANGQADICAVDPVSWQLALRYEKTATDALHVIGEGPHIPGLPLVCSRDHADTLQAADVSQKVEKLLNDDLDDDIREHLFISGAKKLADDDYRVLIELNDQAVAAGHTCCLT